MNKLAFSIALLDSMFPGDPKRNWESYSTWVDSEGISSLPYILEIEEELRGKHTNPSEVTYQFLGTQFIQKSSVTQFCHAAIAGYFAKVPS